MNTETTYWFNNMPKHWQIKRLKDIATLKSGKTFTSELLEENGNYPVYGGNGVRGYYSNYTHEGNYVLIGRQGALCGNINYAQGKFFATEHALVVSPFKNEVILWLGETLKAADYNKLSTSAAQPGLSANVLLQQLIPYPPYEERVKIANYLDNKISNIDAYVSERKKERLLLSDLKKAKVAEIVTKGLSPNVRLKDSGIPSIGMISAHWEVRRFKSFAKTVKGKSTDYFDEPTPNSQIVLTVETLRNDSPQFYNYAVCDDIEQHCTPDDIIIIWDGAGVGEFLRAKEGLISSTTAKIVLNKKMILPEFFWYFGYRIEEVMKHMPTGMGIPHLNPIILANMEFAVPPLDEQRAIASYLDHECEQIEKKCALIDKQIQQLQLLKRALINEVVTGKKAI